MKIHNTTTGINEELRYNFNGCDALTDLHGNSSHGNKWNEEEECWEMSQEDIDWWTQYVSDNTEADELESEIKKELSDYEDLEECISLIGDMDMEDQGAARIAALKEFVEENEITLG